MAIVWAGGLLYLVKNGDKPKQVGTYHLFLKVEKSQKDYIKLKKNLKKFKDYIKLKKKNLKKF